MTANTQWQLARDAAKRYDEVLVPAILGPAAAALVDHAAPRPGETVLDVGCGTGAAARLAARRAGSAGRVIAVDLNAGMIDVARTKPREEGAAPIDWRVEHAERLPLAADTIDLALGAQTLQLLKERRAALSELHRVLVPGGRVALSLWSGIAESPYFHALADAIARHLGAEAAAGLLAAFGLSDPAEIRALLAEAELDGIETKVAALELPLPPLGELVPAHVGATPMAAAFEAAGSAARAAIVEEVTARLSSYVTREGARVPFRTNLVSAVKPG